MTGVAVPSRWSIKTKSLVLFAGYTAALCAVWVGFTISLLQRETAAAHDRLRQTADMLASELDAYVQAGRQRLDMVARLPGLGHGLPTLGAAKGEGPIPPWTTLHYLFFKSPVFTGGVFLVDQSGTVLWTEPPGQPWAGRDLSGEPAVERLFAAGTESVTRGFASSVLLDRPHVILAAAIETPDGARAGTLCGIVDLTAPAFAGIAGALSTAQGRFAAVLDQNGAVLAGSSGVERLRPLATGESSDASSGEKPLLAAAPLTSAPWRVVAGQSRATALAEIRRLQRLLFGLGAALTMLVLAVGAPFVRRFVGSIVSLTRAAELIAGGDLTQPVAVGRRDDEVATLAKMFERMREEVARSRTSLEQRLEEREELIRLKEEFLANVSHELRTPLNVIIGYTDVLLDRPLPEQEVDLLVRIRAQSEHLFTLLRDLMTLAGLNTGKLSLEVRAVTVPEIMEWLSPMVGELQRGKSVDVVWECPPTLPVLRTDPVRLEQVLSNLVTNAFKFTTRGRITIRAWHDAADERVIFEVADTGIGIPAEEIPHIFDEFRQVDGSMSRRYGGVGLGLALVKKLTALLQGQVAVASRPYHGSTFSVAIPLQRHA